MAKRSKSLVVIFVLTCCAQVAHALDRPQSIGRGDFSKVFKYVTEYATEKMDDESVPGLSLALFNDHGVIWSTSIGYANREKKTPVTSQTLFRVGAITTLVTAVAVMQLVDEGKVSLSDPITKYIPEFSIKTHSVSDQPITVGQLLTHHSGLSITVLKGMWSEKPDSLQTLIEQLANHYTSFPPGKLFSYSNLGYSVLGRLIEKVTGKPYADVIQEKIFKPLNMESSFFMVPASQRQRMASGYKNGDPKILLETRDVSAIGLTATAEDIARFGRVFLQDENAVLSSVRTRQMMQPQNKTVAFDLGRETGLGWQLGDDRFGKHRKVAYRYGTTLVFRSRITLLPEEKVGLVVMTNSSKGFRATEDVSEELLNLYLQALTGQVPPDKAKDLASLPPVENQGEFEKNYVTSMGHIKLVPDEKNYLANVFGWNFDLVPEGQGWYSVRYDLLGFIPLKLDWISNVRVTPLWLEGNNVVVSTLNGRPHLFGTSLQPQMVSKAWQARLGEYRIANPDAVTEHYEVGKGKLLLKNGLLLFDYKLPFFLPVHVQMPLQILNDEMAIVPGFGTGLGETIRVEKRQGKEQLEFSGYYLERVN